jgi:hypothetical protein
VTHPSFVVLFVLFVVLGQQSQSQLAKRLRWRRMPETDLQAPGRLGRPMPPGVLSARWDHHPRKAACCKAVVAQGLGRGLDRARAQISCRQQWIKLSVWVSS